MNPDTSASYTGSRPDILLCIPGSALTILDVGCSNGSLGAELRAQVPRRTVWGIDFDTAFCEAASHHLHRVIQADLNHFDWSGLQPASFDCLIFADVLEHLVDPWRVLRDAARLLSPGGSAVLSIPNIRHISALYSIVVKGFFPRRDRGLFDKTHLRWFTRRDAVTLCQQAGLEVRQVVPRLRLYDAPGGRGNDRVEALLGRISSASVIREFLAYQFILTAIRP